MNADDPRDNIKGGAWLIADMSLNIWALSIVKALGADYAAAQVVFLRAAVGLVLLAPLIWRHRASFRPRKDMLLHLLRVTLSVITLTASFFAIARLPLALFTAVNFTRPIVTMVMAALLLRETIGTARWVAAAVALVGVLIAVNPTEVAWTSGLAALGVVILSGSGAVIATRRLRGTPQIVMMTYYTAGLAAFTAPLALWNWVPVQPGHLAPLLLIGVFAQSAQACFLRAHHHGEAGFLSILGYLSLVLSVSVGYLVFEEIPTRGFWIGAVLVVSAAAWTTFDASRARTAIHQ
ncbi:DMT family transporter [Pseudoruegeria sp. HB172150]|uniref:DMT family transporter n=1 Tax=Pseudoruegeria sp. HB172150 TaxID=2721164 RepID=UPI0015541F3A|nr:DMT family transporter [Pseudoruegeria sp. HB172150]